MTLDQITYISCFIIVGAFIWLLIIALRVQINGTNKIKKALLSENMLSYLDDTKLAGLVQTYINSIKIKVNDTTKTNVPSSEFFF